MLTIRLPTKAVLIAAAMACQAATAPAQEPAPDISRDLVCAFDKGQTWSYGEKDFTAKASAPLSFEISAIDLENQQASLIVDAKRTGTLKIVRALNANSFLEVANEGFLNLTTVYDLDPQAGYYPAVHSRHFGVLGQPVFAQYAGTCKPKAAP